MADLVERLRAHDINLVPEWKDEADKSMWLDTADALIGEAADRIEALERELADERDETMWRFWRDKASQLAKDTPETTRVVIHADQFFIDVPVTTPPYRVENGALVKIETTASSDAKDAEHG